MQEIDKRIGLLRLLIADIDAREQQRSELSRQYGTQRRRIVEATVHQAGDLGQALPALREVEERLAEVEQSGRHLQMIRTRAATELEALLLTKRVAEAKAQLGELESRQHNLSRQLASLTGEPTSSRDELVVVSELTRAGGLSQEETGQEEMALRELNEQVEQEIHRLHKLIHDASQRAARSITLPSGEREAGSRE